MLSKTDPDRFPNVHFRMSPQPRRRRGLATWLLSTTTPLFVVDQRRRVVFFNAGCEQLTGWSADEVVGQVCDFVSHPDHTQVEALTGVLCPPPEAFDGAEPTVPAMVLTRSGDRLSKLVRFFPIRSDDHQADRVLGIVSDIPQPSANVTVPLGHQRHAELSALRSEVFRRYNATTLVGCSSRFRRLMQQVELACRHSGSVHFQGEPGTGKEHLARLIHFQGASRRRAFVPLDAARLTRSELSETVNRVLREARDPDASRLSPGTLYLRHVDRLPDSIQATLVEECGRPLPLEFWKLEPEGRTGDHTEDASPPLRLLSSSNDGLDAALRADKLSDEFFHLLTAQQIHVPPLRDRPDDIPLLAQHFLESLNRDQEMQMADFAEDVWDAFQKYSWPGNLDELQAVIAEARQRCDQHVIRLPCLPFEFRAGTQAQSLGPSRPVDIVPLEDKLAEVEREHIQQALDASNHNKSQAAQLLGITRARLYRRMENLGLADH